MPCLSATSSQSADDEDEDGVMRSVEASFDRQWMNLSSNSSTCDGLVAVRHWQRVVLCCCILLNFSFCGGYSLTRETRMIASTTTFLAKTRESFKLSDLQWLELSLEANLDPRFSCQRLLVDASTASSLLKFTVQDPHVASCLLQGNHDNTSAGCLLPPSLSRCEWIGRLLIRNETAQGLVENISPAVASLGLQGSWILDHLYLRSTAESSLTLHDNFGHAYTEQTLTCAIAQALWPLPAALNSSCTLSSRLLVIDTSSMGLFLVQLLPPSGVDKSRSPCSSLRMDVIQWSRRPFQYSSAIQPALAEIVVDLLINLVYSRRNGNEMDKTRTGFQNTDSLDLTPIVVLDPTCGSGTFLAYALDRNCHVIGWDSNPKCIEGTYANLQHLVETSSCHNDNENSIDANERASWIPLSYVNRTDMWTNEQCRLLVRDSSQVWEDATTPSNGENLVPPICIDCMVCNLPWGVNSKTYSQENERILGSTRQILTKGTPCAVILKQGSDVNSSETMRRFLTKLGYEVLGQAQVPPSNFQLPSLAVKKKKGVKSDRTNNQGTGGTSRKRRSDCTIVIAVAD